MKTTTEQGPRIKPARELAAVATGASLGRAGDDESLPIAARKKSKSQDLHVVILYHGVDMAPRAERITPPYYAVTVNAVTAEVVDSGPVAPADFGVDQTPHVVIEGFGLDPSMTPERRLASRERLRDISHVEWELYDRKVKNLSDDQLELVRAYDEHFRRIAIAPLLPYYQAIGGDFLLWVLRLAAR